MADYDARGQRHPGREHTDDCRGCSPWWDYDDVNPVCGHHRGRRCALCGVCTTCDGCYCGEVA